MKLQDKTGSFFRTKQGCIVEIIKYNNSKDCTIRFDNGFVVEKRNYSAIKKGLVKNPFHKSVFGVGFIGVGDYNVKLNKFNALLYSRWSSMLARCYLQTKRYNSYSDCIVCEDWHSLQVFGEWFKNNYDASKMKGWHLDKDILLKKSKIYSPETCCFVPPEINGLFVRNKGKQKTLPIGVFKSGNKFSVELKINHKTKRFPLCDTVEDAFYLYKKEKEEYIYSIAEKWKGIVDDRVYKALINYKVEITD